MKQALLRAVPRSQRVARSPAPDYDPSKVERVERLLGSRQGKPSEVAEAISSLTDAELTPFGLKAFHINMLSVLGDSRAAQDVAKLARAAAIYKLWSGWKYFHDYLPRLPARHEKPHLGGLPVAQIRAQLERGRGLVVATFHHGQFRHLASDLAIAGVPVCMPLAADAFQEFTAARNAASNHTFKHLNAANVEEVAGPFKLAKALFKGECICATIDGNTGLDGSRGNTHRIVVDILGCRASVKTGLIAMAAAHGTPILPLFAHTIDRARTCHAAPIIDPGGPLSGVQAGHFAEQATWQLYALFAESVRSFPDQWSGCDHFHLWRVPDTPATDHGPLRQRLTSDIEGGGRATMNNRRILDLSRDDDLVWLDVKTLQCYRLARAMRELTTRLSSSSGVTLAWLSHHEARQQLQMWALMRQLAARGAIESHGAASTRGKTRRSDASSGACPRMHWDRP